MPEVRILLTIWVGDAWDKLKARPAWIRNISQMVGFFSDRHGRDKHLIKCRKVNDYHLMLPELGDPPREPLSEEEATRMAKADKALRQQIRMVKRKARREQGRLRRKNR